ncbi:N-acetyltransferase [Microbacterium paraoxydans]|uniref:GNAT family N-acetyltransferase n=1 Tax=Microbacterium paraoxydans TaxID=199592 RepID=UPI002F26B004
MSIRATATSGLATLVPYTDGVLPELVDFHARTLLPGGRKFPTSDVGVSDGIAGHVDGTAVVLREHGAVAGYAALFAPSIPEAPGWHATVVHAPAASAEAAALLWERTVAAFRAQHRSTPSFLRVFASRDHPAALHQATTHGFTTERTFHARRRPLTPDDATPTAAAGLTAIEWDEVYARGLAEQVRHVQYVAFLEHFGGLSKSPSAWERHLRGAVFAPELSVAVLADGEAVPTVVGVLLASRYTDDSAGTREVQAHADYIGVLPEWRRRGVAETAIRAHLAIAAGRGYPAASLGVDTVNDAANRVYERLGYAVTGGSAALRLDA